MPQRLAERIRQCAALTGSGDELARLTGIPRRTLEYYLSGEREPKVSRCLQIARAAAVAPGWLISGEGSMRATEPPACRPACCCLQIPLLQDGNCSPGCFSLPSEWLGPERDRHSKLLAIMVGSDAMAPTLRPGDVVVIDTDSQQIQDGQLFVLQDSHGLLIRRLQCTLGGQVRIISDNPRYPEFVASGAQLALLGRVIWKGGPP